MTVGHSIRPEIQTEDTSYPRLQPHETLILRLYEVSGGSAYSISLPEFRAILAEIVNTHVPMEEPSSAVRELLESLRVEELALARACAAGAESAWDVFLTRYREGLYSAALSIAHDDAVAHDLADSLYADLFGTEAPEGRRVSKLNSYSGMGSLQGWLRTILAHGFIDRFRSERPVVSLSGNNNDDEDGVGDFDIPAPPTIVQKAVDPRVEIAIDEALQSLDPEDRFILASYFLHGRTLAELGRTLGVHESTISRRIDKLTGKLRKKISSSLSRRGMSRAQVEEALDVDIRDLQINVRSRIEENSQDSFANPSLDQEQHQVRPTEPSTTDKIDRDE